jgi:acyl-phosphate glycerol 3-phosphate acyltransferase
MSAFFTLLCLLLAYGAGCVNPAYYSARSCAGVDLRRRGSGTLGTRNIYRLYGFRPALAVFCFDAFKLWPVLYLLRVLHIDTDINQALTAFCGIIGHICPVQLGFRGGKGLATFIGASLYIMLFNPDNHLAYLNILPVVWAHMRKKENYDVKFADSDEEFEQIFALNYQTFVEEIPQHPKNLSGKLKDKFHDDNTYLVCKNGVEVVGMVSFCAKRPFSLDAKIENLDSCLPPHTRLCEIRLLAVKQAHRRTRVAAMLLQALSRHLLDSGFDLAIISGTTRQLGLYEKLGFQPFYGLVGKPGAYYQPMYISRRSLGKGPWPC